MPIVKRTSLIKYTDQLEKRYNNLISEIQGTRPNENIYDLYEQNPDDFIKEYSQVDDLAIDLAINDFKGILKELKKIKSLKAKTLNR